MPDTYTSTLGAILMGIGGDNNTWGTNLNNSVIQILEDAIANALSSSVTGGTLDLSANPPPNGPSGARYETLIFTGTLASNQIVKVPNLVKKWRVVNNCTLASFTLSMQTPSGTPVAIPAGAGEVRCDGANNMTLSPYWSTAFQAPNGSAAAPSHAFASELSSGWYRNGTQDIRLAVNGADVLQVTGAGAATPSVINVLSPNSLALAGASAGVFTTGDVKLTFKTVADAGWVLMNDSTIGDASSNASYANANASALFQLLYNNIADADAPILTSGGSATTRGAQGAAATAFANHCRLTLPLVLGRALAAAGSGAGLSPRTLGHAVGEETHTLSTGEMPAHSHGITEPNSGAGHQHQTEQSSGGSPPATVYGGTSSNPGIVSYQAGNSGVNALKADSAVSLKNINTEFATTGIAINNTGGGGAHNTMQPTTFLNVMIKL